MRNANYGGSSDLLLGPTNRTTGVQQSPTIGGAGRNRTQQQSSSQQQQHHHPRIENKLRQRDVVAIIIGVIITKMGWSSTSMSSTTPNYTGYLNLQWYLPRHIIPRDDTKQTTKLSNPSSSISSSTSRLVPVMLDIDGDGTSEAMVSITQFDSTGNNNPWIIQILDMKPIMKGYTSKSSRQFSSNNDGNIIYRPIVLLESDPLSMETIPYEDEITSATNPNSATLLRDENKRSDNNDGSNSNTKPFVPLDYITTHVPIRQDWIDEQKKKKKTTKGSNTQPDHKEHGGPELDRTLQFFCGVDWHDAATKCAIPCPTGSGCPEEQRCFADTPCTNLLPTSNNTTTKSQSGNKDKLDTTTTPGGGVPSIFTLWSNGVITMHSITVQDNEKGSDEDEESKKKKKRYKKSKIIPPRQQLQVQQMWKVPIPVTDDDDVESSTGKDRIRKAHENMKVPFKSDWSSWKDVTIEYVDSYSANNGAGLLIVMASALAYEPYVTPQGMLQQRMLMKKMIFAISVSDGTIVWKNLEGGHVHARTLAYLPSSAIIGTTGSNLTNDPVLNTMQQNRGYDSSARRRSRIPGLDLHHHDEYIGKSNALGSAGHINNCLKEYRYSILTSSALPHAYYNEFDANIQVVHFEHQGSSSNKGGVNQKRNHRRQQTIGHGGTGKKKLKSSIIGGISLHGKNNKKRQRRRQQQVQRRTNTGTSSDKSGFLSWLKTKSNDNSKKRKDRVVLGRPNVVVVHDATGIQVRSLKNGKPICHLSLASQMTYDDINHDGTIDIVSSIVTNDPETLYSNDDDTINGNNANNADGETDEEVGSGNRRKNSQPWNDAITITQDQQKWVQDLVNRIQQKEGPAIPSAKQRKTREGEEIEQIDEEVKNAFQDGAVGTTSLCHVLALSGIPAKEQLFSVDLCGRRRKGSAAAPPPNAKHYRYRNTAPHGIEGTAPLLVESIRRGTHRGLHDVVTAVNTGVITRVSGITGKIEWQVTLNPKLLSSDGNGLLPDWDDPAVATLQRISVIKKQNNNNNNDDDSDEYDDDGNVLSTIAPAYRPILYTGDESMVVISPMNGKVIAYSAFPQPAMNPPVVTDYNGDGISDIIVVTTDAVWGYQMHLHITSSIVQRIIYGILVLFLLLCFLFNQIQPVPGKRSTDP